MFNVHVNAFPPLWFVRLENKLETWVIGFKTANFAPKSMLMGIKDRGKPLVLRLVGRHFENLCQSTVGRQLRVLTIPRIFSVNIFPFCNSLTINDLQEHSWEAT